MTDPLNLPSASNIAKFLGSSSLTEADILRLSEANAVSVRAAIAANPHTSSKILAKLACDPSQLVRLAVATNTATPDHIVKKLELDSEPEATIRVNELDLAPEILIALMQHKNPYIRAQAKITWEGRKFEQLLLELGLKPCAGTEYRLGELLVEARFIEQNEADEALAFSKASNIPLGRTLLQTNSVTAAAITTTLRIQHLLRQGSIEPDEGIKQLHHWRVRQI